MFFQTLIQVFVLRKSNKLNIFLTIYMQTYKIVQREHVSQTLWCLFGLFKFFTFKYLETYKP
jgi:hypothetical protein